jgi:hypothetical protein
MSWVNQHQHSPVAKAPFNSSVMCIQLICSAQWELSMKTSIKKEISNITTPPYPLSSQKHLLLPFTVLALLHYQQHQVSTLCCIHEPAKTCLWCILEITGLYKYE